MNATMNRLSNLTVKVLREIAAQMGVKLLSRDRKVVIVGILFNHIESAHEVALMANETYAEFRELTAQKENDAPKVSLLDYPAVDGRGVTEAHAKICRDRGCVSYVKNGMDMGFCPRCGEITTSEEQVTEEEIMAESAKTEFFPHGDARNFDSHEALNTMINALAPMAAMALAACEASISGPVRDMHYQAYQDFTRATDEMRRTLAFFTY